MNDKPTGWDTYDFGPDLKRQSPELYEALVSADEQLRAFGGPSIKWPTPEESVAMIREFNERVARKASSQPDRPASK